MKLSNLYKKIIILALAMVDVIGFILCLFTIFGFLGKYGWHFDIFSHFRAVYLIYFLLCLVLSVKRSRVLLLIWVSFAVINLIPIVILYIPEAAPSIGQPKLKIMTINFEAIANHHFDRAVACIKECDPDIISLQEIDSEFATYLKKNLPQYAYNMLLPDPGYRGVGCLSKYPIDRSDVYNFGNNFPVIACTIRSPLGAIMVIVVHPLAPYTPFQWGNESIFTDGIAQICKANTGSIILAGDLNSTAFSYQYQRMLELTRLRDSNRGFGFQTTWHAELPIVDIDHCFMSNDLVAIARRTGPNILSDHLPLYVEITKAK